MLIDDRAQKSQYNIQNTVRFRNMFLDYKSSTIEREYNQKIEEIKRKNFVIIFLALILKNIAMTVYCALAEQYEGVVWRGCIVGLLVIGIICRNKKPFYLDIFMVVVQISMMVNAAENLYPNVVRDSTDEDVLFGVLTTFTLFTGIHYFQNQLRMLILHLGLVVYFNFSSVKGTKIEGFIKLSNLGLAVIYLAIFYFDIKFNKEQYFENWMKWRELQSWKTLLKEQLPTPVLIMNQPKKVGSDFELSFWNSYFENSFNIREHKSSFDNSSEEDLLQKEQNIKQIASKITLRQVINGTQLDPIKPTLRDIILDKIKQLNSLRVKSFQQHSSRKPNKSNSDSHIIKMGDSEPIGDHSYQNLDKLDTLYGTYKRDQDALERTFRIKIGCCFLELKNQVIIMFDEITEIEQNKRLQELNSFKDEILGMVSHDLKTPLYCIEQLVESGQDQTDYLVLQQNNQIILQSCKFLLSMIHSILDYTQFQMGRLKLVPQELNFYDIAQEVISLFRQQAEQRKITLSYEGPHRDQLYGKQDSNRIKQVLINLVSNSFKYTDSGSIKIRIIDFMANLNESQLQRITLSPNDPRIHSQSDPKISLKVDSSDQEQECPQISRNLLQVQEVLKNLGEKQFALLLAVEDTGSGMPEDVRENLFKPFSTFDHHQGSNKYGVGLGLMICDKIARILGPDTIRVVSTEGKGSTFSFLVYRTLNEDSSVMRQSQISILINNEEVNLQKQYLKKNQELLNPDPKQDNSNTLRIKNETYSYFEVSPMKLNRENAQIFNQIPEEFKNLTEYTQKMRYSDYTKTRISMTQLNSSQANELYRKASMQFKPKRFSFDAEDNFYQQYSRDEMRKLIKSSLQNEAAHKKKPKINILLVDDESFIIIGIRQILSQFSQFLEVYDVSDGVKAIEFINNQQKNHNQFFDYLLIDMNMKSLSGLQTIKKINENIQNVYPQDYLTIIINTAQEISKKQQEVDKKNYGFHFWFSKPIDFNKLYQIFRGKESHKQE